MLIKNISTQNFRNLNFPQIEFGDRLNIFLGDNGQGKTNILEAIYLLTENESFRYSKNENLIAFEKNFSSVSANIINKNLDYKYVLKIQDNKKKLVVNDKPITNKKNGISSILFSPESLNVIKEGAEQRRNLIDQLVAQSVPSGYQVIRDFKKALRMRNRLLKDISEQKIKYTVGMDTLTSLNQSYLLLATELTRLRINALSDIKEYVQKSLQGIHGEINTIFSSEYIISDKTHNNSSPEELHFLMQNRMIELEKIEVKTGTSLVGPQKHNVIFLYNGNDSRFYCSQGQQRSIILAYKMAQIVYHHRVHGFYPLLLLDDVLSELDLSKQESLIATLNQTETQTFVTTTDVSLLSKLSMNKAGVFKIKNGQIV